jgi:hypothetical protein
MSHRPPILAHERTPGVAAQPACLDRRHCLSSAFSAGIVWSAGTDTPTTHRGGYPGRSSSPADHGRRPEPTNQAAGDNTSRSYLYTPESPWHGTEVAP